jgi:GntR family transcriptional regulator, transcriptional repressor for pyruvate dehydrogenase complex
MTVDPGSSPVPFSRIAQSRGHEEVAQQIREAILSQRLLPSDRLPSSRNLAEQFGVSRALIIEALRVLEHSGLVVTRTGARGGTFVRKPTADQVIREVGILIRSGGVGLAALSEIRELLEGQNAVWAAKRATAEQLDALREVAEEMRSLATTNARRAGDVEDLDVRLHTILAEAAHNELSAAIVMGIVPALRDMIGLLPPHIESDAAEQYEAIYRAIARRDARAARAAMVHHVAFFAQMLGRRADAGSPT